jgi:hypothetical protein
MWLGLGYVMVVGAGLRRTVQPPEESSISVGGPPPPHFGEPGRSYRTLTAPASVQDFGTRGKVRKDMSPIWMFEGTSKLDPVSQRNLAERRFSALAAAIRQHQAATKRQVAGIRAEDAALYRKLRQICGQIAEAEEVA